MLRGEEEEVLLLLQARLFVLATGSRAAVEEREEPLSRGEPRCVAPARAQGLPGAIQEARRPGSPAPGGQPVRRSLPGILGYR